ncbi:MAG: hypothetical protein Q9168_006349 [Polycauliona sp. 1 TL-2023]
MTATTALTAQNTQGVLDIHYIPSAFVSKQIDACIDDIGVDVVKIGMLASAETVDAVARSLEKHGRPTCVLDPVFIRYCHNCPKSQLTFAEAKLLLENAGIAITPEITSVKDLVQLATQLQAMGPKYVLVKGGHMPFDENLNVPQQATARKCVVNVLHTGLGATLFITAFSLSKNTHGTGCSLASAIASNLARGDDVPDAVEKASEYVEAGIKTSPNLGHGSGPINHFHSLEMDREPPRGSSLQILDWSFDD